MSGTIRHAKLDSRTARAKLRKGRQAHWQALAPRVHLGYQRQDKKPDGSGRWILRRHLGGNKYILFERWEAWAKARGEFVGSARHFSQRLEANGFKPYRKSARGFSGLTVYRNPDDQSNGSFIWTGA